MTAPSSIPLFPPEAELETRAVLKKLAKAHRYLAELKTLAAEVVARLYSVISSFLGETVANLRKVFDFVVQNPVIALFDEFDALTKDRGDAADHGELKRSVNTVLQMLDGYRGARCSSMPI